METDKYYSIESETQGFYKDRGSKFYAHALPVESIEELEQQMGRLKKKYHDARHHCYAYRLGMRGEISFSNDDGEPAHSAGAPILGAIRSASLSKVLVVVIRYFGGTKLGVRGLIEAYRSASQDAIGKATFYPLIETVSFRLSFRYDQTAELNRILHPFTYDLVESSYTDMCEHIIKIPEVNFSAIEQALQKAGYSISVVT